MADPGFSLDDRLEQSSHLILRHDGIQIRLVDDKRFAWLLLIPETADAVELHDLDDVTRRDLFELASQLGAIMKRMHQADKINIAAIGNIVPQLHVHVVARRHDDDAWPGPIWGFGSPAPMEETLRHTRVNAMKDAIERELSS